MSVTTPEYRTPESVGEDGVHAVG